MKARFTIAHALMILTLFTLLTTVACTPPSSKTGAGKATSTPLQTRRPTSNPTLTPTPELLSVSSLKNRCSSIETSGRTVMVSGQIRLPAVILCASNRCPLDLHDSNGVLDVKVLLGSTSNTMDKLPTSYAEKDLMLRAFDGQIIKHNHRVRLTGLADYKDGLCALVVTRIESLMPPGALTPLSMTISEAEANCADLQERQQVVRIRGKLQLHYPVQLCSGGTCGLSFYDASASITAQVRVSGGPNSMKALPKDWSLSDLQLRDKDGSPVPPESVTLTGLLSERNNDCTLTVEEIE